MPKLLSTSTLRLNIPFCWRLITLVYCSFSVVFARLLLISFYDRAIAAFLDPHILFLCGSAEDSGLADPRLEYGRLRFSPFIRRNWSLLMFFSNWLYTSFSIFYPGAFICTLEEAVLDMSLSFRLLAPVLDSRLLPSVCLKAFFGKCTVLKFLTSTA